MRVSIYPNFISREEIDALNAWVELGVKNRWLDKGITIDKVTGLIEPIANRVTSRFYAHRFEYPQVALDISNRIRTFLGINEYSIITGHGKNGIVVSYTRAGADVHKHKDPRSIHGLATLRCNILTQKADAGGQLHIEGQPISLNVGDLHCYLASEHEHWAPAVEGNTPRIMWMFGAHVPAEDWNSGKIKAE